MNPITLFPLQSFTGFNTLMPALILASASPRRRELIRLLGIDFQVIPSRFDESSVDLSGEKPDAFARILASHKADEVATRISDGLILGADTIVVLETEIMGKPKDEIDAARMLQALSGRTHQVVTGVSLLRVVGGSVEADFTDAVSTDVRMRAFDKETIQAYIATGEPMDKAGAYAIQERGSLLIDGIDGDFFNVVGLPVGHVAEMLRFFGIRCL